MTSLTVEDTSTPLNQASTSTRPRSKEESGKVGKKGKGNYTCPICNEAIKEPMKHKTRDDFIYCEGSCDAWLHHRCAGLSLINCAEYQKAGD